MEPVIDLYATQPPHLCVNNGSASLVSRLVWCGVHYMERQLFYARELAVLIEELYGEVLSSAKVSFALKRFAEMGYVERVQCDARVQTFYLYRVSENGIRYMRRNGFK